MNIFYSRKAIAAIVAIVISVASLRAESLTAVFNWANPAALIPAFEVPGPGSLGVYLDGKTITANGVKFFVDDSEVKELSRKARFYYGYLTNAVELRIYSNSDIIITAPDGMVVDAVSFTGPEADSDFITPYGEGYWDGTTWIPSATGNEIRFYSEGRCELSTTTVLCKTDASVGSIEADATAPEQWYDLSGRILPTRPSAPGIYLLRQNGKVTRHYLP